MAAKLIVLGVEGMDDSSSHRIEAALADRYNDGLVAAVTAADSDRVTILARADSNIDVANTIIFLQELGFQAQEATEAEYQAAQSALPGGTIEVPTSVASVDGDDPSKDQVKGSVFVSLDTSLDPLSERFNRDKGRLRFVALLSPT